MSYARKLTLASAAFCAVAALQAQDSFAGHDRNGDGVVTRDEWTGNMRTFRTYDTNRDGVLSGTELPRGWRNRDDGLYSRGTEPQRRSEFTRWDRNGDDMIQSHEWRGDRATFRRLDLDRDGRLSWSEYGSTGGQGTRARTNDMDRNASGVVEGYEWPYNRELFHQLDTNGDSVLSSNELSNLSRAALNQLDTNRSGALDRDEWPGGFADFRELDGDGDGRVTSREYFDRGGEWQRRQRFREWDKNGDGIIQSTEWQTENALFHRLDTNANSQVEWEEFRADTNRYPEYRRWQR